MFESALETRLVENGMRFKKIILTLVSVVFGFASVHGADEVLEPGYGFMLIRLHMNSREVVGRLSMSNVETDDRITVRTDDFVAAGANAWMTLVSMPEGRYFWSEYEAVDPRVENSTQNLDQMYRRSAPASADDTFEIVAGAVNYAGDWTMQVTRSSRTRVDSTVKFEKTTMERFLKGYPAQAGRYKLYLSMQGKAAISLEDFARIVESQSKSPR